RPGLGEQSPGLEGGRPRHHDLRHPRPAGYGTGRRARTDGTLRGRVRGVAGREVRSLARGAGPYAGWRGPGLMGVLDDLEDGLGKVRDGLNTGLTVIEHGVDAGKKVLGEGVDWGTDRLGEGLDKVGLEGAADAVED